MFLLDTNVLSELRKVRMGMADARVTAWSRSVNAHELFVSVITIEELEIGMLRIERRDPSQGTSLRRWLHDGVIPTFSSRTLTIDTEVALRSATLQVPDKRPARDALLAGTALVHRMIMVTRNVADFANTGVSIVNPWNDP